jgi:hypothetical protein
VGELVDCALRFIFGSVGLGFAATIQGQSHYAWPVAAAGSAPICCDIMKCSLHYMASYEALQKYSEAHRKNIFSYFRLT